MNLVDWSCLMLTPLLLSAGQALFKATAQRAATHSFSGFAGSLLASPYFWAALFVYGAATLLWVFVLSRVPLSRAMSFVALAFVIAPVVGAAFFGERPGPLYWLGVAVIAAGVCIAAAGRIPA